MKRLFLVAAVSILALAACMHGKAAPSGSTSANASSGRMVESRTAGAFTRLEVRGPVDVVVHEGRPFAMNITADGIPANKVTTEVDGDVLVVDVDRDWCIGFCGDNGSARLDLDVPVLDGVTIEGSGDVTVVGAGAHAKVAVEVNGSGDVHYAGAADLVACRVEGSGDVTLSGSGKSLEVSVAGSGDVDARAFAANGGKFDLEGSGDVTADLHGGDATIRMHGSGDLRYSGDVKITSLDIEGSGDVKHL